MEKPLPPPASDLPATRQRGRELRTRYVPKARLRLAYLHAVPWLDLLLVLFYLVLVQARVVLRPGVNVTLPAYAGRGVQGGAVAVLTYTGSGRHLTARVYFQDEMFRMEDPVRVEALALALRDLTSASTPATLTLYADHAVPHAHVLQMMQIASSAGIEQFNLGTSPPIREQP